MPAGPAAPTEAPLSRSFVTGRHVAEVPLTGWRRALAAVGLKAGPSAEEVERQADVRAISRHWPGPRTVAVANPKGGAGKTPTAMLCAALFARLGGSGVLAWCNNVTRGSLGWRGESGTHGATVLDLLGAAPALMGQGAQVGQLAAYVRHQSEDRYEILASAAHLLPTQQRITAEDFDAIWRVVTKYYRLAIIDSGNEETAENWVRMVDRSDVLVVPMTNRRDHAEAAREMLQQLRAKDAHSAWLSRNAVVVVSEASSSAESRAYSQELAAEFGTEGRDVVVIPHDPGIGADWLRYDGVGRRAQRAYLRTAALIAERLDHPQSDPTR
jgi:cellulose biosynthesis protein BcsQ